MQDELWEQYSMWVLLCKVIGGNLLTFFERVGKKVKV